MDNTEKKILEYIESNKDNFITFLQDLIRIPSLTGEEKEAQVFVADELKKQGYSVELFEPDVKELFDKYPEIAQIPSMWIPELDMPIFTEDTLKYSQLMESEFDKLKTYKDRPNVIGKLPGTGGGKSLILNGHIDVVTIGPKEKWAIDPWGAEIKDGKIFGRGSTDMKGGIVAMIKAMEAILKTGIKLRGDVMLQSVVNEEHAGNGTLACIAKGYKADAVITTEGTNAESVNTEGKGGVYYEVVIKGRETHTGARWKRDEKGVPYGISAIEKSIIVMQKLLEMEAELNKDGINMAFGIGQIKGGSYATSTALECKFNGVAYFSPNLGTGQEGLIKIKKLLIDTVKNIDDPWLKENPAKILFNHYDDAYRLGENGKEILETVMQAGKEILGKIEQRSSGANDSRHFINQANIPAVIFGPGYGVMAHSANEYVFIDSFIKSIKVLAIAIYRWCK